MADDSLLEGTAEAAPAEGEATESAAGGQWSYAEGVAGQGEKPEWLAEKFTNVEAQAKAFSDLEGTYRAQMGAHIGTPADGYEVKVPEGIEAQYTDEDPLLSSFQELCGENQISQEFFEKAVGMFMTNQAAANGLTRAEELQALGVEGPQLISDLVSWGKANLSEEQMGTMRAICRDAETVRFLSGLTKALSSQNVVPSSASTDTPSTASAEQKLTQMLGDPRWEKDPVYQAEVEKAYKDFYGDGEAPVG